MEAAARGPFTVIALDTHSLLWWLREPHRLSNKAQRAIAEVDRIGLSPMVFWEVALLVRKKRFDIGASMIEWTRDVLSLSKIEPLALTAEIAVVAEGLAMHPDPADRFIVATALHHGVPLVSKDTLISKTGLIQTIW
jgi:PIN domain nuclease of toxin-antitoxin system